MSRAKLFFFIILFIVVTSSLCEAKSRDSRINDLDLTQCDEFTRTKEIMQDCTKDHPGNYASATRGKKIPCNPGYSRWLGTSDCRKCNLGYKHDPTKRGTSDKVCKGSKLYRRVTHKGKKKFGKSCPGGQFYVVGHGCNSCEGTGYKHDSSRTYNSAYICYKNAPTMSATTHAKNTCSEGEFKKGGYCWKCPDNYKKTLFAVSGGKACVRKNTKDMSCYPERKGGDAWPNFKYGWHTGAGHPRGFTDREHSVDVVDCASAHHDLGFWIIKGYKAEVEFKNKCDNDCAFRKLIFGMKQPMGSVTPAVHRRVKNDPVLVNRWRLCGCNEKGYY